MDERSFYTEKEEIRKVKLVCPSCRGEFEAPVRWKVCRKKRELPRGAGEEDRRKFAKATSYMVRLEDLVACYKCRKRFELTGQSTVLINDNLGDPSEDPENFGNRRAVEVLSIKFSVLSKPSISSGSKSRRPSFLRCPELRTHNYKL